MSFFALYVWTIYGVLSGIYVIGLALTKALWPTLQRHKWVIGGWDD